MLISSWQFFNEMETEGIHASVQTFGAMIDGCARAGDVPKAFGIYKKMLNQVHLPGISVTYSRDMLCVFQG